MTHYIVVRRDLPFGVLLANIAHAAGESFYKLQFPGSSVKEHSASNREVAGLIPARGSTFNPSETVVVVLGARNERKLQRLCAELDTAGVEHVSIVETDGDFKGQMMAIGLVPGEKADLARHINEFHMFPHLEPSL